MKKLVLSLALAAVSFVAVNAQTADEIVTKMVAARGGAEKLKGLKSVRMEANTSVMGMDLPTKMTIVQKRGMKTEISAMGQEVVTAVDGDKAWMLAPPMGVNTPTEMPADQTKGLMGQLDLTNGLLDYKETGIVIELLGTEKLDGADVFKMKMTPKDGMSSVSYVDATTYYIVKTTVKVGEIEAETKISNYKMVDGLAFPFTTEVKNEQMGAVVTNITKVEVNPVIDLEIFKMPKQ